MSRRNWHRLKLSFLAVVAAVLTTAGCTTPITEWPARFAHELRQDRLFRLNQQPDPRREHPY